MRIAIVLSLFLALTGCQSKPTKVFESSQTRADGKVAEIPKDAVLLDARPSFEYTVSHLSGAINMRWDEFTQPQEPFRGLFETDLYFHARRLARLGISPETPVVILGRGPQGGGEEGRLAWTLRYMGVKNVRFHHINAFDRPLTNQEAAPKESVPIWKPEFDETLNVTRSEFMKKSMTAKTASDFPVIIDVRPANEYLGKVPSVLPVRPPDLGAINIPWTEFITSQGGANLEIKDKLEAVGITPEREIIAVANRGVESATVTLILRDLGYSKAANYGGGYADLLAEPKKAKKNK